MNYLKFWAKQEEKNQVLVVSETKTSTWTYHLRLVVPGEEKYGGGAGPALCGRELGWDTKIPLSAYGARRDHIPTSYCEVCRKIAEDKGFEV